MTAKELKPGTKMIIAGMEMEYAFLYHDREKTHKEHPAFRYELDGYGFVYINKNYTKDTLIKDLK